MDFILLYFRCFERFFKAVNSKEGKLKAKRRAFLMDDVDLIGTEYLWRVSKNLVSVLFL
jgi:ubiquitin carboxyl-terminal hydrolase 9/24